MDNGVGTVELKKRKLTLPEGGLKLAYGGVLKEVEVAYEECGAPLDGYNAVYICHALTGDAHVAGMKPGEDSPSGWWEGMVGPGRAIDTNRYHVICANVLGGCSGTTGPMSINPDTGKPYGSSFPQYTFDDAVDVFRMLLRELGVKKLAALIGGSYGGLQVVNWMTRFPDEMEKVCLIATSAALNTQAIALSVMSRNSITDDPNWKGGDYYEMERTDDGEVKVACGQGPRAGLASARQLAHITYLSRELLQKKFQRNLQQNFVDAPAADRAERDRLFKTYFQIESYLDYQAMKFLRRFDANSYLHINRSMDLFDPADRYGSMDAAFARVQAKVLVVSYRGDILFPWWQSKEIVASLMKAHKSVSYCHLESGTGHDSFLTDIDDLSKLVGGFLGKREVKVMKWQERLHRGVLGMVGKNAHVVDIGCGDGTLLNVLRAKKGVKGDGIDIEVERIEEALADGHDMFWDDVDDGLETFPDGHYDTAIVSDTLQEVKNPRGVLSEALRIAKEAIVTFPNFAAYRIRMTLAFTGRLPVSKQLPFQWYDTPNIHCITLKDFKALCDQEGYEIKEVKAESRHFIGKLLLLLGFKNLGASKIVARIAKKKFRAFAVALLSCGVTFLTTGFTRATVQTTGGYNSWPMITGITAEGRGRLVCAYSRGSAHSIDEPARDVFARSSNDGGITWGAEIPVATDPTIGEVAEGVGLDSHGAMLLWVRCWGVKCRHELYRTTDGVKFEQIAKLTPSPMPMQITNPFPIRDIGLVSFWFAGHYRKDGNNSWGMLVSTDDGRTWSQRTIESGLSVKDWVTEPSGVYLGDGRILIIGRCEQNLGPQFQVVSTDNGKTWKKMRTNIADVMESTPSLVYDSATGLVSNYYYQRGAKQLKRRVAKADFIFDRPTEWPDPEVLDGGKEQRFYDAGNVNVTRFGGNDCCAWYTGTDADTSVIVTLVPAPVGSATKTH